jgi:hypothetical protein
MEAKELRIGNYFYGENEVDLTVHGIGTDEVENIIWYGDELGFYESQNKCFGIPIDEGWLLKFGFEKRSGTIVWHLDTIEITQTSESFLFEYGLTGSKWIQIKYVHQLQNLYFALTGKELELIPLPSR